MKLPSSLPWIAAFTTGDDIVRTTPWPTNGAANGVYMAVLEAGTERIAQKVLVQR